MYPTIRVLRNIFCVYHQYANKFMRFHRNFFNIHHFFMDGNFKFISFRTGQHAVFFCQAMHHLVWQTSDVPGNHGGIRAWLADASLSNVLEPLALDVLNAELPRERYDGVFSANTAHIMNPEAVEEMFTLVAAVLQDSGVFVLYGPFRQGGRFNAPSNADFHRSLRHRDPGMGIRHLEELDSLAQRGGMRRVRLYAMPANNNLAVWVKDGGVAT